MSVIVSKFAAKCTVCGVRIPAGTKVNWARKVAGVSHAGGCAPVTFKARSKAATREEARIYFEEDDKVLNKVGKWVGIIEQVANKSVTEVPTSSQLRSAGVPWSSQVTPDAAAVKRAADFKWATPVRPRCTRGPACKGCNVCNEDGDGSESETEDEGRLPF